MSFWLVGPGWRVFGGRGGWGAEPGPPVGTPTPLYPGVMVAAVTVVSYALWRASAKHGAEPDAGLDRSGLAPGHPQPGVLAHSDHRAVTLTGSRRWPTVCSLALLPGDSWGMSERVARGAAESFLPGSWGAGAAPGRGVREGVSWQFAASPHRLLWAPRNMQLVAIYHLAGGGVWAGPELRRPQLRKGPRGLLAAITPGEEGPDSSWLHKCFCLYRLWKSVLWAMSFVH